MGVAIAQFSRHLRNPRTVALLLLAALVLWWPVTRLYYYAWVTSFGGTPKRQTDFNLLQRVLPPADATLVSVLGGLPHQRYEKTVLLTELLTTGTVSRGGYRFRSTPLSVPQKLSGALTKALSNPSLYFPYARPKMCGGYHPDYCFQWRLPNGESSSLLLCTGCFEAIIVCGRYELHCDVNLGPEGKRLDDLLREMKAH